MGHLIVAEEAREQFSLQQVIFAPVRDPWRKARRRITAAPHRLAMVRLAVSGNPEFAVSTVDLDRPGPSYSVDTLQDLRRDVGESVDLYFILGGDALADLPYWREPARIAEMARLVVARRSGKEPDWSVLEGAVPGARSEVLILDAPEIAISSTAIRQRVAAGRSIRYWVPDAVEAYIREHRLYLTASG